MACDVFKFDPYIDFELAMKFIFKGINTTQLSDKHTHTHTYIYIRGFNTFRHMRTRGSSPEKKSKFGQNTYFSAKFSRNKIIIRAKLLRPLDLFQPLSLGGNGRYSGRIRPPPGGGRNKKLDHFHKKGEEIRPSMKHISKI